ncbi:MAG TPA: asparagine--tRNA ligase [Elusimicrobia bacterium]|nr:asparagine--tRNA ligase [Elusimicrobiota bacterium]HBT61626.1 asparagine--tRNA ligase [Elusimicrobiota bacterium]
MAALPEGFPPAVRIKDLKAHAGQEVSLQGWLYNMRSKGKLAFLLMRDGSGICQAVVFQGDVSPEVFERAKSLTQETALVLRGSARGDERSPGGVEIGVKDLRIVHQGPEYPIGPKEHGPDFLLTNRHLWLRSRKQAAIARVRHQVKRAISGFFDGDGFVQVDAPIFTPSACEGTSNLFELEYFEEGKAYLTQSGQLYMEAAAMALGKVYCFGPTFRAERSKTRRHLTEFWMVEPEVAYCDLNGVMDLAERFLCHVVRHCLENCREDLKELERDASKLEKILPPFPRVSYDEAAAILKRKNVSFAWGDDFGAPQETAISEEFDRPVMVHRYPADVKAFYMKRDPADEKLALCVDVLAPEGFGEIIGGGQRADDLSYLEAQIGKHGLPKEAFEWYLDLRRYGSVPHGGFGLGVERTTAWICGTEHIRETIAFPRMLYRIYP